MLSLGCACAAASADAAPVIGQFELKTLDSATGSVELQSQNAWSWGHPARQVASATDGLVIDDNAVIRQRHALEIELGFTSRLKMRAGIEFEKERIDDPATLAQVDAFDALRLNDIGLELIAVLAQRTGDGVGVGVVAEFERSRDRDEPDTLVLGSIVEFRAGRWFVAAVPMVVRASGGDSGEAPSDDKWDFMYAAQLSYGVADRWSIALEGYGTVERIQDNGHPSEAAQVFGDFDQHRAGVIVYYTSALGCVTCERAAPIAASLIGSGGADDSTTLTIGVGLLTGLNGNTPDQTLKLSIELDF